MVQLKQIPDVWNNILKKNPADLSSLHVILFKKLGKEKELKQKIGTFAGFDWADDKQEKQKDRLKERLKKREREELLEFCEIFNLHYKSHVTKTEAVKMLLDFLQSLRDTTEEEQVTKEVDILRGELQQVKEDHERKVQELTSALNEYIEINKDLQDKLRIANGQLLEGETLRKQQNNTILDVTNKLEEQRYDSLTQLMENEMLRNQLKQKEDQIALSEQQFAHQLKQKSLELQIADLKIQQHEEKFVWEQSQMKMYAEQDALVKSNEVFETFKQEIEKMSKSIKELKKENTFLRGKTEKSDFTLIQLVEERERMKKQLEKTKNQKEQLESLCRSLQAERKQNPAVQSNVDSVPV